jgi:hypothetical protein
VAEGVTAAAEGVTAAAEAEEEEGRLGLEIGRALAATSTTTPRVTCASAARRPSREHDKIVSGTMLRAVVGVHEGLSHKIYFSHFLFLSHTTFEEGVH